MANTPPIQDVPPKPRGEADSVVAPSALVILAAGMCAAWFAAGSTGLLGHALTRALVWSALAVALTAAWPRARQPFRFWAVWIGGAAAGLLMTASSLPAINVLAVAVVLAAVAQTRRGLTGRVTLIAALAAGALGVLRFAQDSIPTVWWAANLKGFCLGKTIGWLAGSPLTVGSTFAGLDFLWLMAALFIGWLVFTAPPRRHRALWAAGAIVVGHCVYLAVLAHSEKLLNGLPDVVLPPPSETSKVGLWAPSNALRLLFPWNLPLLALAIQVGIAVAIFRCARWIPVVELDEKQLKKLKEKEEKEEVPGSVLMADMLFRFGPPALAAAAVLLAALSTNRPDLQGKTVVAYEKGYLNWLKPEYDSPVDGYYGMLPMLVESLGGKWSTSGELSEDDLAGADLLVMIHPDEPWPRETLERVWNFVRRGGSLLVAADAVVSEGDSQSSFNDVLQPTSMRVRYDTAVTRTGNWEQSYQPLAHPATVGLDGSRNCFGFELGASIHASWPARPVVVGRWGWSDPGSDAVLTGVSHYNAGEPLGDLVLAAEQPMGRGRVFVLGGAAPLRNETLAASYSFVGRLLGYLAHKGLSPQAMWRQLAALAALVGLIALMVCRPAAWQVMLTSVIFSAVLVCATAAGHWSGRVLPDGRNRVAYVDATHLEAYSSDPWTSHGVAGLLRTLMRQGMLPLFAPDLAPDRLQRAGLLISIGPARRFSEAERNSLAAFVGDGGSLVCMVGAQEARPSAAMLADFEFAVRPSPAAPSENIAEPEPLGPFRQLFGPDESERYVQFYAGWPVDCSAADAQEWVVWSNGKIDRKIVVSRTNSGGAVVVIGDTHFGCNENLETLEHTVPDNIRFWRWLLSRVMPGQKPWDPPPAEKKAKK